MVTKTLEEKKAKLKAELAKLSQKITKEERKADARKKILVGAFVLSKTQDPVRGLNGFEAYLKKDQDRALFGLPPLATGEGEPKGEEKSNF